MSKDWIVKNKTKNLCLKSLSKKNLTKTVFWKISEKGPKSDFILIGISIGKIAKHTKNLVLFLSHLEKSAILIGKSSKKFSKEQKKLFLLY